jgi:hypothetical protein
MLQGIIFTILIISILCAYKIYGTDVTNLTFASLSQSLF